MICEQWEKWQIKFRVRRIRWVQGNENNYCSQWDIKQLICSLSVSVDDEYDNCYDAVTQHMPLQGRLDKNTTHVRDMTARSSVFWVWTWTSPGWMQIVWMSMVGHFSYSQQWLELWSFGEEVWGKTTTSRKGSGGCERESRKLNKKVGNGTRK